MSIKAERETRAVKRAEVSARRTAIRREIDTCPDCDDFGRRDDLTDCPQHRNFRLPDREGDE